MEHHELSKIRGEGIIREQYAAYLSDESRLSGGTPDSILFPCNAEEVSRIVAHAARERKPIRVSGSRTGLAGGAVPQDGELIMSTEKLVFRPRIKGDKKQGFAVTAGAGMSIEALAHAISGGRCDATTGSVPEQAFYPVDTTETSASIGGTIATNASGARTLHYGPTRDWVKGLTVVLADGSMLKLTRGKQRITGGLLPSLARIGSGIFSVSHDVSSPALLIRDISQPAVKHTGGYFLKSDMDLIDLFIGSEGTLGIVAEAELRLAEPPAAMLYLCVFFPHSGCLSFTRRMLAEYPHRIIAAEYMDSNSLELLRVYRNISGPSSGVPGIPGYAKAVLYLEAGFDSEEELGDFCETMDVSLAEYGIPADGTWAGYSEKEHQEMKQFRHALPERINSIIGERKRRMPELTKIGTDMAVPLNRLEEMLNCYCSELDGERLQYCVFGHIGNGHLHVNILPETRAEQETAWRLYRTFAEKAVELGGSVSAEHGIGTLKKHLLQIQYTEQDLELMRRVKQWFDPHALLNRGVLF